MVIVNLLAIICALASLLLYAFFVNRLRKHHLSVWKELGAPGVVPSDFEGGSHLLRSFLFRGRFFNLKDKILSFLGLATIVFGILTVVLLLLSVS